jgi:hypothetical protein
LRHARPFVFLSSLAVPFRMFEVRCAGKGDACRLEWGDGLAEWSIRGTDPFGAMRRPPREPLHGFKIDASGFDAYRKLTIVELNLNR